VPLRKIRDVVSQVVDRFDPERVILFGSHGYGRPAEGSDVDMLVIMHTRKRPVRQAIEIVQTVKYDFPLDLIVRTPSQVEKRLALGDFFLKEIMEKGRVLYERPRA
jgi:predicted nucleotidyltransferase